MKNQDILTVEDVAGLLKVSRTTVFRWKKQGLPHIKLGSRTLRFDRNDVLRWAKKHTIISQEVEAREGENCERAQ